jgi:CDP-diacylglycerol---glycerol-3-phosphate 3-phosphatidyltransferase
MRLRFHPIKSPVCKRNHRPVKFILINALTLARLIAGLAFPLVGAGWRPAVVLAAGFSDLVDGAISRHFHATSTLGRLLDPIADKTFVLFVVGTLWFEGSLSTWQIVLVGLRDWTVLGAGLWHVCAGDRAAMLRMAPSILGKVATGGQFAFLIGLMFFEREIPALFWIAVVLSGLAAIDYLRRATARPDAPPAQ